jgi:predicted ester cyclase
MDLETTRKHYLEALNAGTPSDLPAVYAPDAIRKAPGEPDCLGAQEITKHYESWMRTFKTPRMADQMRLIKGNVMVSVWCWKAVHAGEFMGIPASDKEVGLIAATVQWFDAQGFIVREHSYADPYTLMIQLGAIQDTGRGVPAFPERCEVIRSEAGNDVENLHRLRRYNQLLLDKQLEPWLDCMTDDIAWDDQMVPGLAVGKEHSRSDFVMLAEAFPDARINMTNMWAVGPYVVHQGDFIATHKGPIKGIPASNRVVHVDNMDIAYFEGGKIRKGWTFGNTLDMGSQMGMGGN